MSLVREAAFITVLTFIVYFSAARGGPRRKL